jgi:site-specific DNA-cytosine methylase
MRLLELFSGTGSVGKAFREQGWEVVSVDLNPKAHPTICCDVRNLDVASLPPIDCVWASPVCTQYSIARTTGGPRNLEAADELVLAALSIVAAMGEVPFFMENPYTGLLKTRPFMQDLPPPRLVDYCKYGYPYRKRTAIWTNTAWEPSQPVSARLFRQCGETA